MAKFFEQNIAVYAQPVGDLLYYFKKAALAAGWTMLQCGDGTSEAHDGTDLITQAKAAVTTMWYLLQMPDGNRKLMVARLGATAANCFIGYMATGTYNTDGNATTPCSVATGSEQPVNGTVGPRATAAFVTTATSYYVNTYANSSFPYDFYAMLVRHGGANLVTTFLGGGIVGIPSSSDTDPFIIHANSGAADVLTLPKLSSCNNVMSARCELGCRGYRDAANWVEFALLTPFINISESGYFTASTTEVGSGVGPSAISRLDNQIRPLVSRRSGAATFSNPGFKGAHPFIYWNGVYRSAGVMLSENATGDRVCFGHVNLPWNNVPPRM